MNFQTKNMYLLYFDHHKDSYRQEENVQHKIFTQARS